MSFWNDELTQETLETVEVLTVFLKNDAAAAWGPSQVHRFEAIERILRGEVDHASHHLSW
jgi:hypothetical protein